MKEAALRNPLDPLALPGEAGASNAFAAMGRRAAAGQPLLHLRPPPRPDRPLGVGCSPA